MMNNLYKSLTIAIMVIPTFISGTNADLAGPQNSVDLDDGFILFDKIRRQR